MEHHMRTFLPGVTLAFLILTPAAGTADVPAALAAPGEALVATIHAQGAQVYECKADAVGKLAWQFREPIATLLIDGKTVGRHYAGPTWELSDGSMVAARSPHGRRAPRPTTFRSCVSKRPRSAVPVSSLMSRPSRGSTRRAASRRVCASAPEPS
jgi:hypothetical protein